MNGHDFVYLMSIAILSLICLAECWMGRRAVKYWKEALDGWGNMIKQCRLLREENEQLRKALLEEDHVSE